MAKILRETRFNGRKYRLIETDIIETDPCSGIETIIGTQFIIQSKRAFVWHTEFKIGDENDTPKQTCGKRVYAIKKYKEFIYE